MTQGEWISVDDRLPKLHEDVLVYANNEILIAYIGADNDWLYYEDVSSNEFPVEYWMPLPAPPEHIADVSKKISSSEFPNNHTKAIEKGEQQ